MIFEKKLFDVILLCYFKKQEFKQNYICKQNIRHCDKTTLQIFFYFYNFNYLCSINISCQNSAKIPSGSEEVDFCYFLLFAVTAAILDTRTNPI